MVQGVRCFSFMNRLADRLGVSDAGSRNGAWALRLMGPEGCSAHQKWTASEPR